MSDRSEHSANRDLHSSARMPRPAPPQRRSTDLHWAWQALFAVFCGLVGAAFLVYGLST